MRVLLIEDSTHFQTLVKLLMAHNFPEVDLHVADDGIVGLAMAGELQPDVLIVDILLPGIDGATLIMSLRSHPQFANMRLIVITSLDEADRARLDYHLQLFQALGFESTEARARAFVLYSYEVAESVLQRQGTPEDRLARRSLIERLVLQRLDSGQAPA